MSERIRKWRWCVADWLSFAACKLRGQKWCLSSAWHGVPGNRAADLQQQIWTEAVAQILRFSDEAEYREYIESLESKLWELAQLAGENWGHIQPKGKS